SAARRSAPARERPRALPRRGRAGRGRARPPGRRRHRARLGPPGAGAARGVARGGVPGAGRTRRAQMRKTLLICRRELAALFGGPLAYGLAAVFALLTGYFFYSDLVFFVLFGGASLPAGLWRFVFLDYRLVALLVLPLLSMRLLAEERKLGTLELLWTYPVRDREVLAGKFLAALLVYLALLALTVSGPIVLYVLHPFAPGPVLAGYVGLVLLGTAFLACGTAASAVTETQVVAALLPYCVLALTPERRFTLSAHTREVLARLHDDVRITAFYSSQEGVIRREMADLLALYQEAQPHIAVRLLDLDRSPGLSQRLGVSSYNTA